MSIFPNPAQTAGLTDCQACFGTGYAGGKMGGAEHTAVCQFCQGSGKNVPKMLAEPHPEPPVSLGIERAKRVGNNMHISVVELLKDALDRHTSDVLPATSGIVILVNDTDEGFSWTMLSAAMGFKEVIGTLEIAKTTHLTEHCKK